MNRPSVGELWNGTIAVTHRHFASFAVIAAVTVFLPSQVSRLMFPELMNMAAIVPKAGVPAPALPAGFWPWMLVIYALYAVGLFSIAAVTADPDEGGGRTMGTIIRSTFPAIGKAILAALLFTLAYLVFILVFAIIAGIVGSIFVAVKGAPTPGTATSGLVVAIVAGVLLLMVPLLFWVGARLSPMTGVYLSEDVGVIGGIKRAWALSKGSAGTIIIIGLLLTAITLVILTGQIGLVKAGLTSGIGGFVGGLVMGAIGVVIFVYQAAGLGYLYQRLRAAEA